MVSYVRKQITKSIPSSVECDCCGRIHDFTVDDILYYDRVACFCTLTFETDSGFSFKKFELHFCSIPCLVTLLNRVQCSCDIYIPKLSLFLTDN